MNDRELSLRLDADRGEDRFDLAAEFHEVGGKRTLRALILDVPCEAHAW